MAEDGASAVEIAKVDGEPNEKVDQMDERKEGVEATLDYFDFLSNWARWRGNAKVNQSNMHQILPELSREYIVVERFHKAQIYTRQRTEAETTGNFPQIEAVPDIEAGAKTQSQFEKLRDHLRAEMAESGQWVKNLPLTVTPLLEANPEAMDGVLAMAKHTIGNSLGFLSAIDLVQEDFEDHYRKMGETDNLLSLINKTFPRIEQTVSECFSMLEGNTKFYVYDATTLGEIASKQLQVLLPEFITKIGHEMEMGVRTDYDLKVERSVNAKVLMNKFQFRVLLENFAQNAVKGWFARRIVKLQGRSVIRRWGGRYGRLVNRTPNTLELKVSLATVTEADKEFLAIEFKDNGIGIPPEIVAQGFGRGHSDWQESGVKGTGIGMATLAFGLPDGSRVVAENWIDPDTEKTGGACPKVFIPTI